MSELIGIELLNNLDTSWDVNLSGYEREQLEKHYLNIDEDGRNKIFSTAAKILSYCPNPRNKVGRATGLALGKVQSGKTASFIALAALAYDNAYRIIIVLAGTKKNLLKQNNTRITTQFNLGIRTDRKIAGFSTKEKITDVRQSDIAGVLENGNNVLITVLKHHAHINHIKQILSSSQLNGYPTLIIDDEGDQASLNAKVNSGKRTATYKEIIELRDCLKLHAYVAVTATPQANLLIKTIDDLSPEFCVLIEPGKGYTGGSIFHGKDSNKYIRNIPDNEVNFEDNSGMPQSFIKALSLFLIGACIRTLRGDNKNHSMLVHTSHEKGPHKVVSDKVDTLVELWKQKLSLMDGDPGRETVLQLIKENYKEFEESGGDYPAWEQISSILHSEIKNLRTWIVNSSDYGQIPTTENMYLKNNIFIGGNMLDRGVTLDGLAVTYITRWSKEPQADTVEQRARWFGYKESYLDVCRVYMTTDVSNGFHDLLGHEDDLWQQIIELELSYVPIKSWSKRIIKLEAPFKPTRSSVAKAEQFSYDNWIIQLKPIIDTQLAKRNVQIVSEFLDKYNPSTKLFGNVRHKIIQNCKIKNVITELLDTLHYEGNDSWDYVAVKQLFNRILKENIEDHMGILLMREGKEERGIRDGKIINLMQGHSVRIEETSPDYYKGDRDIHDNRIQLQIHLVSLKGANYPEKTVALALYIPDSISSRLGRLMRGKM